MVGGFRSEASMIVECLPQEGPFAMPGILVSRGGADASSRPFTITRWTRRLFQPDHIPYTNSIQYTARMSYLIVIC